MFKLENPETTLAGRGVFKANGNLDMTNAGCGYVLVVDAS